MSIHDLGKPYDVNFRRLQNRDGQSLYPRAGAPSEAPLGYMEHAFVVADSEQTLAANASAWGISANASHTSSRRYASYRALQLTTVYEIDDTTNPRAIPSHAVYYPWRIYVGHSYEMLFEGSSTEFHVGVQASLGVFSGAVKDFARSNNLNLRAIGRGLQPKGGAAIFAKTEEEIEQGYETTGEPAAILVEWRVISGRRGRTKEIAWTQPREGCAGEPGCTPCKEWEFDYVEWRIPSRKSDGNTWDGGDNSPEVVLTLRGGGAVLTSPKRNTKAYKWKLSSPFRVQAGTSVGLSGKDIDVAFHDDIGKFTQPIGEFHAGGKVVFGGSGAFMTGSCVAP